LIKPATTSSWSRLIGRDAELVNQIYYRHLNARSRLGEAYPDLVPLDTPADQVPARENLLNSRYDQTEINYALYVDQEFSAGDWSFRAGARYDRDNFSQENLLSPRAAATWLATNDLRITATIGRYYQAPRIEDRAADAANNALENEVVDQFGIGFAYR